MDELSKFLHHIRNLQNNGVHEATFDVDYLVQLFERVQPTPATQQKIKAEQNIVGDGGSFSDGD
tara:strand:+ start:618 stop:809 length:192 start_codon:yes stop_codon:yes gene_type:complete